MTKPTSTEYHTILEEPQSVTLYLWQQWVQL